MKRYPVFWRDRLRPVWRLLTLLAMGAALIWGWQRWTGEDGVRRPAPTDPAELADSAGYAARSRVYRALGSESRAALLLLANSDLVADRSAARPAALAAFDRLTGERLATFVFRDLVLSAPPAGQVYGLCGLYRLRSPTFLLAQAHLYHEPSAPVRLQTVRDAFEDVGTHQVAGQPLEICRRLVPADEELLEDPEVLRAM
jgi:hypothetical protein